MRRKTRILIQTNGQRYKQANQLSGAQMNTEHMKRCSNSLVFREIQMKTAMRYRSAIMGELESWVMLCAGGNWGHRCRHALGQCLSKWVRPRDLAFSLWVGISHGARRGTAWEGPSCAVTVPRMQSRRVEWLKSGGV